MFIEIVGTSVTNSGAMGSRMTIHANMDEVRSIVWDDAADFPGFYLAHVGFTNGGGGIGILVQDAEYNRFRELYFAGEVAACPCS